MLVYFKLVFKAFFEDDYKLLIHIVTAIDLPLSKAITDSFASLLSPVHYNAFADFKSSLESILLMNAST